MINTVIRTLAVSNLYPDRLSTRNTAPQGIELAVSIGHPPWSQYARHWALTTPVAEIITCRSILFPIVFIVMGVITNESIVRLTIPDISPGWVPILALVFGIFLFFIGYRNATHREIAQAKIYFLLPGEPFPVLDPSSLGSTIHVLAVRALDPNVRDRLLAIPSQLDSAKKPVILNRLRPPPLHDLAKYPEKSLVRLAHTTAVHSMDIQLADELMPVAKLIIDRILHEPPHPSDPAHPLAAFESTQKSKISSRPYRFVRKLLGPQLAGYIYLTAIPLPFIALGTELKSQYPLILAVAAAFWTLWSIWLYQLQHRRLLEWADLWSTKPMGSCPIYYFRAENEEEYAWEELNREDFAVELTDFGIDVYRLSNILFAIALALYCTYLGVIK